MKCGIRQCMQTDNNFLWRCYGTCNRTYHAACVGVQRNREEYARTFMLPLCQDCQEEFLTELKLKALTKSLEGISKNIGSTLEANHRLLTKFNNLSATHDDALEQIEKMLGAITHSITNLTSRNKLIVEEIKNAISSHFDTPSADTSTAVEAAAKSAATAAVAAITTTATNSIDQVPNLITALKSDLMDSQAILACDVKLHIAELTKTISTHTTASKNHNNMQHNMQDNRNKSMAAWRIVGSKNIWKRDWTEFDARQCARRLQEKNEEKARKRRRQRKRQHHGVQHTRNTNISNNKSDKQLLAAAKVQFAGPPPSIEHPIPALSVPKLINFRKGETINPYRTEKINNNTVTENIGVAPSVPSPTVAITQQQQQQQQAPQSHVPVRDPSSSDTGFNLDPMLPPIVRLTRQSTEGDGRFLKARLRDSKIMHIVRLYLAYMKDQQPSVCMEGMTPTSIKMLLASEGLPTAPEHLQQIFTEVHLEYGLSPNAALADLAAYRKFLTGERTRHLQQMRESANKFYNPTTFRK